MRPTRLMRHTAEAPAPEAACLLSRTAFGCIAEVQDALSNGLGALLDFLHGLADAGARSLVAANGLLDVVIAFHDELLHSFVCIHGLISSGIGFLRTCAAGFAAGNS